MSVVIMAFAAHQLNNFADILKFQQQLRQNVVPGVIDFELFCRRHFTGVNSQTKNQIEQWPWDFDTSMGSSVYDSPEEFWLKEECSQISAPVGHLVIGTKIMVWDTLIRWAWIWDDLTLREKLRSKFSVVSQALGSEQFLFLPDSSYPTSGYLCDDVMDRNGPDLYTMIHKIESWAGPAVPWDKVLNDDDFSEENWPEEINRLYFLGR